MNTACFQVHYLIILIGTVSSRGSDAHVFAPYIFTGTLFSIFYAVGGVVIALILVQQDVDSEGKPYVNIRTTAKFLTIATSIFSITFGCTAIAQNFTQQAIIRMVMGLTQSVVTPLSVGIINELFSVSDKAGDKGGESETMKASAFGVFNYGVYLAFSLSLSLGKVQLNIYDIYVLQ